MTGNIIGIVEKQIEEWKKNNAEIADEKPLGPTVSVSREKGAGGYALSSEIARILDFKLYHREIVEAIAKEEQVSEAVVNSVADRYRGRIDQYIRSLVSRHYLKPSKYLLRLMKVVLSIAAHGNAVILGRGAAFFLDPEYTLSVHLTAPLDVRVQRVAARDDMPEAEARALVLKRDMERAAFFKQAFYVDWTDPRYFSLVLNTEHITPEQGAAAVAAIAQARFGERKLQEEG